MKKKVPLIIIGESYLGKVKKKAIVQYLLNQKKLKTDQVTSYQG